MDWLLLDEWRSVRCKLCCHCKHILKRYFNRPNIITLLLYLQFIKHVNSSLTYQLVTFELERFCCKMLTKVHSKIETYRHMVIQPFFIFCVFARSNLISVNTKICDFSWLFWIVQLIFLFKNYVRVITKVVEVWRKERILGMKLTFYKIALPQIIEMR